MKSFNLSPRTIEFRPLGIFKNRHVQTIYSSLNHKSSSLRVSKRILVPVDEGTQVACDVSQAGERRTGGCVVLVHGLGGSSESTYMRSVAAKLVNRGIDAIRLNIRNCGDTAHLTGTLYHAGLTEDVFAVSRYACCELGYERVVLAGFSLGANTVLKMFGELGEEDLAIEAACVISPPLDLSGCVHEIIKWHNRIYDQYYVRKLKNTLLEKLKSHSDIVDPRVLDRIKTLYDFDDLVTAPHFGFRGAEDYYSRNSALQFISKISRPVMVIQAKDDPVIPFKATQTAMETGNSQMRFVTPERGGHVGFINSRNAAKMDDDIYWAENRMVDFVQTFFPEVQRAVPQEQAKP